MNRIGEELVFLMKVSNKLNRHLTIQLQLPNACPIKRAPYDGTILLKDKQYIKEILVVHDECCQNIRNKMSIV